MSGPRAPDGLGQHRGHATRAFHVGGPAEGHAQSLRHDVSRGKDESYGGRFAGGLAGRFAGGCGTRAVVRNPGNLATLCRFRQHLETKIGDATDLKAVGEAHEGCSAVVNLVTGAPGTIRQASSHQFVWVQMFFRRRSRLCNIHRDDGLRRIALRDAECVVLTVASCPWTRGEMRSFHRPSRCCYYAARISAITARHGDLRIAVGIIRRSAGY
jgi:hypothetical protein